MSGHKEEDADCVSPGTVGPAGAISGGDEDTFLGAVDGAMMGRWYASNSEIRAVLKDIGDQVGYAYQACWCSLPYFCVLNGVLYMRRSTTTGKTCLLVVAATLLVDNFIPPMTFKSQNIWNTAGLSTGCEKSTPGRGLPRRLAIRKKLPRVPTSENTAHEARLLASLN